MPGVCRTVVALCALVNIARAQPLPEPVPPEPKTSAGADTKIPVTAPGSTEVMAAEGMGASTVAAPVPIEQPLDPDTYICGPGDLFELNFWGQQNFRLRFAADLEGRAFVSKVGFVRVSGKTLTAVRKEVDRKVRADYPGLQFELTLVAPRTFLVHVANNVKHPGSYVARPLERVSEVLASAGGVTGSRRRIQIRHRNGANVTADLVLYELSGDTSYNPYVLDGDVITVPFADVTVTISGAVHRPGSYELVASKDLSELLQLAGGFTSSLTRSLPMKLTRRDSKDLERVTDVPFAGTSTPNVPLQDADRLDVRSIDELQSSVLLIGAVVGSESVDTATTSKRLTYIQGDTVLSLIDRAGGIRAPGDLRRSYISRPRANGAPEVIPVDLEALLVRRDFSADRPIAMNDTIVIPPMQYSVLVEGAVARAGLYPFNPQFGIPEYIAHAGGRTRTAQDLDDVKLIDWNGKTHDFRPGMKLSPGDAILVPERNFTRAEIVQLVLAGAGLLLTGIAVTVAAQR